LLAIPGWCHAFAFSNFFTQYPVPMLAAKVTVPATTTNMTPLPIVLYPSPVLSRAWFQGLWMRIDFESRIYLKYIVESDTTASTVPTLQSFSKDGERGDNDEL
jgi:hypothetical protein